MKKERNLLMLFLLLMVFSLNLNANTKTNVDAKAGATTKVDTKEEVTKNIDTKMNVSNKIETKAGTTKRVNSKTISKKKLDAVVGATVSQIDKWKTLINLNDYVFKNKKLLETATFHKSYAYQIDRESNERLDIINFFAVNISESRHIAAITASTISASIAFDLPEEFSCAFDIFIYFSKFKLLAILYKLSSQTIYERILVKSPSFSSGSNLYKCSVITYSNILSPKNSNLSLLSLSI